MDPQEELHETLKSRKTWDNTTLRLLIGDAEIEHRSIEAELRQAAKRRVVEPAAPKKGSRRARRRQAQITTW